jgi:hypothetical protein
MIAITLLSMRTIFIQIPFSCQVNELAAADGIRFLAGNHRIAE